MGDLLCVVFGVFGLVLLLWGVVKFWFLYGFMGVCVCCVLMCFGWWGCFWFGVVIW